MSEAADLLDQALRKRASLARIIGQRRAEHAGMSHLLDHLSKELTDLQRYHDALHDAILDYSIIEA